MKAKHLVDDPRTAANGTRVRVRGVDMFGFTGRDNHPTPADEGRVGTIIGCMLERDGSGPPSFNPAPGTPYNPEGDGAVNFEYVCYFVALDGTGLETPFEIREMMDSELVLVTD